MSRVTKKRTTKHHDKEINALTWLSALIAHNKPLDVREFPEYVLDFLLSERPDVTAIVLELFTYHLAQTKNISLDLTTASLEALTLHLSTFITVCHIEKDRRNGYIADDVIHHLFGDDTTDVFGTEMTGEGPCTRNKSPSTTTQ
jgi:hypothetical protein